MLQDIEVEIPLGDANREGRGDSEEFNESIDEILVNVHVGSLRPIEEGDGNNDAEAEERGASGVKVAHKPVLPNKEEIERLVCLHQPYRSWCRHCVMGRADDAAHKRTPEENEPNSVDGLYVYGRR